MRMIRRFLAWVDVVLTRWETRREKCSCWLCRDDVQHTGKR